MINKNQKPQRGNNIASVLSGLLIGGLAGTVTVLLFAPQSGKETRMQIKEKGMELRNRTTKMVEDSMAQVRSNMDKIASSGREKIRELKERGQELAVEQLDRVSEAAQAGKKVIGRS